MDENDPERLVVVTSTPEGVAPLTRGEQSMIEEEPEQVEQTAVVGHSFPRLHAENPARQHFESAKQAFADSDARSTLAHAQYCLKLEPNYLPAHIYEELGLNISRGRDLRQCVTKCLGTIELGQQMIKGRVSVPLTDSPVLPEHVNELLDMARYNLSDRYMRLGNYREALEQLQLSEMLPKSIEARMKRRIKEASLLYRLHDKEGCRIKLKQARGMDRELFMLLQERMASDGHAGVDQPI